MYMKECCACLGCEMAASKEVGAVPGEGFLLTVHSSGRRDGGVRGFFRKVNLTPQGYKCSVKSGKRMLASTCTGQKRACGTSQLPGCSSSFYTGWA